ncbi:hypothetical protein Pse7367_3660 (plasmid) [Thalassoporum mexicanum PCC 7367]|uniref:hypothetical protein n=1 Tax=Thalassoporum mexicanum TaxID=3457544 RepID=UPI00029FE618|nr:hypothetical protein [Pseudanabaena sp. PCC 7367]AFY71893.1 hypothetical protein Pse7367_3660 [Pseudanabaena sp. PCC 7367]
MGDPAIIFDPMEFDQRGTGFPRVLDGRIDIGATELPNLSALLLDIDGNGVFSGSTDGILITRFGFGFTGSTLINGAVAADLAFIKRK